jgi:hypothetical protein
MGVIKNSGDKLLSPMTRVLPSLAKVVNDKDVSKVDHLI